MKDEEISKLTFSQIVAPIESGMEELIVKEEEVTE